MTMLCRDLFMTRVHLVCPWYTYSYTHNIPRPDTHATYKHSIDGVFLYGMLVWACHISTQYIWCVYILLCMGGPARTALWPMTLCCLYILAWPARLCTSQWHYAVSIYLHGPHGFVPRNDTMLCLYTCVAEDRFFSSMMCGVFFNFCSSCTARDPHTIHDTRLHASPTSVLARYICAQTYCTPFCHRLSSSQSKMHEERAS